MQRRITGARSQLSKKNLLKETENLRGLYQNNKKNKGDKLPETSKIRKG